MKMITLLLVVIAVLLSGCSLSATEMDRAAAERYRAETTQAQLAWAASQSRVDAIADRLAVLLLMVIGLVVFIPLSAGAVWLAGKAWASATSDRPVVISLGPPPRSPPALAPPTNKVVINIDGNLYLLEDDDDTVDALVREVKYPLLTERKV